MTAFSKPVSMRPLRYVILSPEDQTQQDASLEIADGNPQAQVINQPRTLPPNRPANVDPRYFRVVNSTRLKIVNIIQINPNRNLPVQNQVVILDRSQRISAPTPLQPSGHKPPKADASTNVTEVCLKAKLPTVDASTNVTETSFNIKPPMIQASTNVAEVSSKLKPAMSSASTNGISSKVNPPMANASSKVTHAYSKTKPSVADALTEAFSKIKPLTSDATTNGTSKIKPPMADAATNVTEVSKIKPPMTNASTNVTEKRLDAMTRPQRNVFRFGLAQYETAFEAARDRRMGYCKVSKVYCASNRRLQVEFKKKGFVNHKCAQRVQPQAIPSDLPIRRLSIQMTVPMEESEPAANGTVP